MGPRPAPATPPPAPRVPCLPPTCLHQQDPRRWATGTAAVGAPCGPAHPQPPGLTEGSERPRHGEPNPAQHTTRTPTCPRKHHNWQHEGRPAPTGNEVGTNDPRGPQHQSADSGRGEIKAAPRHAPGQSRARRPPEPTPRTRALAAGASRSGSRRAGSSRDQAGTRGPGARPTGQGPHCAAPGAGLGGHCSSMVPPAKPLRDLRGGPPGSPPSRPQPGRRPSGEGSPPSSSASPAASGKQPPTRRAAYAEAARSSPSYHSLKTFVN